MLHPTSASHDEKDVNTSATTKLYPFVLCKINQTDFFGADQCLRIMSCFGVWSTVLGTSNAQGSRMGVRAVQGAEVEEEHLFYFQTPSASQWPTSFHCSE